MKVGMTNRDPAERARELSRATGLPSPFIVVFEQLFEDCSVAERYVHTYLAQKGYRISDNREFFNAPVNQIIRAIMMAPGAIEDHEGANRQQGSVAAEDNETASKDSVATMNNPSMDVFFDACAHYYGSDEVLKDEVEALRLFKRAAALGSLEAYPFMGRMYLESEEIKKDVATALSIFREGARRGDIFCYFEIGAHYLQEQKIDMAEQAFRMFVERYKKSRDGSEYITSNELSSVDMGCGHILISHFMYGREVPKNLLSLYKENVDGIHRKLEGTLEFARSIPDVGYENDCLNAITLLMTLADRSVAS